MAWITWTTAEPTNHEPRSDDGAKGRAFPWGAGATPVREMLPSCRECDLAPAHGSPCSRVGVERRAGQRLEDDVAAGEYASAAALVELDAALWAAAFIGGALLTGNYLFNLGAGTANNVLQRLRVRVMGAVGPWVTVRSVDPRRLTFGISRQNPEWPLPDPITGTTARIQWDTAAIALPVGGIFEPDYPSVLHRKLTPMVLQIEPPTGPFQEGDEVEYRIKVWGDMTNLMQPYDAKLPPADGKYYASIGYVGISPEKWSNWQSYPVAHWTRQTRELTASGLALVSGVVPLTNSAAGACRVLPRYAGNGILRVSYTVDGVTVALPVEDIDAAFLTVDTGTGWATSLDLAELLDVVGLEGVRVDYLAEAVEADGPSVAITKGCCANSQVDHSGSYVHGVARRCNDVGCSKFEAGTFRDDCWDPAATGFTLGCGVGPGSDVQPAADARDNGNLAEIAWSSAGTVIAQQQTGGSSHRNFAFERRIRTGLSMMMGSFCDQVPRSPGAASIDVLGSRVWGQRRVYTDETGERHELVFGAHDATRPEFAGALEALVDGWDERTGQRRTAMNAAEETFPSFGPASCSVVDGQNGGGAMARRLRKSEGAHQVYVTGINPQRVSSAVVDYVERLG